MSDATLQVDVFVSHSSKDKALADVLVNALESSGLRCWIAPRDIPAGASWGASIVRAIAACRVMVVLYSEHSNRSKHVLREIERAVDKDVEVIPVRVDHSPMSEDFEYFLSATHWMDMHAGDPAEHADSLVELVHELMAASGCVVRGAAPADTPPSTGGNVVSSISTSVSDSTEPSVAPSMASTPHEAPAPRRRGVFGVVYLVVALAIASPIVLRALGWFGAEGRDVVSAESVDGVAPSSSGVNKPAAEADSKSTRWSPAVTDDDSFTVVEGDAALRDGVLELKQGWRAKDALLSLDRVPTDNVTLRGELLLSAWYQGAGVRLDCGGTFVEARLNSGVNPRAEGRVMNYRLYLQDAAGEHSRRNVGELGEDAGEQRWMRFEWSRQGQRVTFKVDDHPTHVLDNTGLTPVGPIMLNTWNKPATFRRLEYRVLDDVVAASRERE